MRKFRASLVVIGRATRQSMPLSLQKNTLLVVFRLDTSDCFSIYMGTDDVGHVMRRDLVYSLIWLRVFLLIGFPRLCTPHSFRLVMNTSDSVDPIIVNALANLELLPPQDISNLDDSCPICLLTFRAVLDPREDNIPGKADVGVARVGGCGHLFCAEE